MTARDPDSLGPTPGVQARNSEPVPIESGSFADGYQHGRDDILYALAHGHEWALKLLAKVRDAAAGAPT